MIIGIVAVDNNWAIGKNNGLLFNIKADMKHFREITKNAIVVCGRKTLESFPESKPLKGRSTIVLCSEKYNYNNCICVHNTVELINMVKVLSITNDIYIIGGGMLYELMLPYYDEVIVTKVDAIDPDATVFFPNLDEKSNFIVTDTEEIPGMLDYDIQFVTYRRIEEKLR